MPLKSAMAAILDDCTYLGTFAHAAGLWEVRSSIPEGIARVLFTVVGKEMVLLHGFVKKSQATQKAHLELTLFRMKETRA